METEAPPTLPFRDPDVRITVRLDDERDHEFVLYEDVIEGGPGGRLWDAAVLMAQHLAERTGSHSLAGLRVLEIGAGLGLPGLVAAHQGALVTLTDKARCLELMRLNAHANGVLDRVEVAEFEWGRKPRMKLPFDIVLLSDCVCHDEHSVFRPILKSLRDVSNSDTELLVSYKYRSPTEDVFWEAAEESFDITLVESEEVPSVSRDGDDLPVMLYRLKKRTPAP